MIAFLKFFILSWLNKQHIILLQHYFVAEIMKKLLQIMIVLQFCCCESLNGSDFNSLNAAVHASHTSFNQEFSNFWQEKNSWALKLGTDYQKLELQSVLTVSSFRSQVMNISDFKALAIELGASLPVQLGSIVTILPGIRGGSQMMFFDVKTEAQRNESELTAALTAALRWKMSKTFFLEAGYEKGLILTRREIYYNRLTLGIGMLQNTPAVIKDFLE